MDDSEIQKIIPPNTNLKKPYLTNFEDHLINALAHYRGNKAIYFPPVPMFIYNQSTASITRFK